VRRIERPLQVDFLVAASYGADTISSGNVRLLYDPETELRGKHILLVEDIVDTGKTLNRLWRSCASARRGAWKSVPCCISIWPSISSSSRRSSGSTHRECSSWGTGSITLKTSGTAVCGEPDLMANRIPPPREFSWTRTLRTLSFWALLIVGSIALVQFAANRRQETADISYSQFTEQLDKANVDTVEITERQQVKGSFKTPVPVRGRNFDHFTTLLPFESNDTWSVRCAPRASTCGRARRSSRRRVPLQLPAVSTDLRTVDLHAAPDAAGR